MAASIATANVGFRPMTPLCFVLMPFGKKPVGQVTVDFDAVYAEVIAPAVEAAGLQPLRADEERTGGIVHKQMFERLVLCDHAVADLTGANANVFYELGVRHGTRPRSTVLIFAEQTPPPFDLGPVRALPYRLDPDGRVREPGAARAALARTLRAARDAACDSPLYELLQGFPELDHAKTDVFRQQVDYSERLKADLKAARAKPGGDSARAEAVRAVERRLGDLRDAEAGVLVDALLSYRDAGAWGEMERLAGAMPPHLAATALVQEQLAFALNRLGRHAEARDALEALIRRRGPSPETCGLLGRVFKDLWRQHRDAGRGPQAEAMLDRAIAAYRHGFEADWRDAYPGVNAVSLMAARDPADPDLAALLPVVRYAVERKIANGRPDYWDYASRMELAVLAGDRRGALRALGEALAETPVGWMARTTADTLAGLVAAWSGRGVDCEWVGEIEAELRRHDAAA